MKKLILICVFLLMAVPSYGLRVPNRGEYKNLREYMEEVQEEDLAKGRDPKRFRKAAYWKRPWVGKSLWDMTTKPIDPAVKKDCPDFTCDPVVQCGTKFYCGFDQLPENRVMEGTCPKCPLCRSVIKESDKLWLEYLRVCGRRAPRPGIPPEACYIEKPKIASKTKVSVQWNKASISGLVSEDAEDGSTISVVALIRIIKTNELKPAKAIIKVTCGVDCSPIATITGCPTAAVAANSETVLTASLAGEEYEWTLTGGGSLSSGEGNSITYTAAATNANCTNNGVVSLKCDGVVMDTCTIALNTVGGSALAYRIFEDTIYCASSYCRKYVTYHNCADFQISRLYDSCLDGGWITPCSTPADCVGCTSGTQDDRTGAMIAAGCCPDGLK